VYCTIYCGLSKKKAGALPVPRGRRRRCVCLASANKRYRTSELHPCLLPTTTSNMAQRRLNLDCASGLPLTMVSNICMQLSVTKEQICDSFSGTQEFITLPHSSKQKLTLTGHPAMAQHLDYRSSSISDAIYRGYCASIWIYL
jgi:hypothetical protein